MTDPYKVLGVQRDASDDDIKQAYRKLARKYHPDNFATDETARSMAEEKMKEINEAYDAVQNDRKNGRSYGSAGSSTSDTSYNRNNYITIRSYINAGRIGEAETMLNSVSVHDRGAEWNFLMGCVCASKGANFDAQNYFNKACSMDPSNMEYRSALNNMRNGAANYNRGYTTTTQNDGCGCSGCDICSWLLCADCLCECCGGDLISCC
ncbi:MAG: J domain-containing protein [Clostridia bacterium]|nr:J domain-containing protein [Clostridia bacterium]